MTVPERLALVERAERLNETGFQIEQVWPPPLVPVVDDTRPAIFTEWPKRRASDPIALRARIIEHRRREVRTRDKARAAMRADEHSGRFLQRLAAQERGARYREACDEARRRVADAAVTQRAGAPTPAFCVCKHCFEVIERALILVHLKVEHGIERRR